MERGSMRAISFWLIARRSLFGAAVIHGFFILANNRQRFLGRGKNYSEPRGEQGSSRTGDA
jgi:hypothetical protein